MMKEMKMTKKYILAIFIALVMPSATVFALTPTLSVTGTGDGNNVIVNISGADANTPVSLYYTSTVDGTNRSQVIGTTDNSGSFSGTVNTSSLAIGNSASVYAIINGYQTNSLSWPYSATNVNGGTSSTNTLSFSPTSLNIGVGQTGTVQISGGNGPYTVSTISGSNLTPSISGNTLTINNAASGIATLNVCSSGGMCTPFTVNVGSSSQSQATNAAIGFSIPLAVNQTLQLGLTGGNGTQYYIQSGESDPLFATINGNTLTVNGMTSGTSTVTVCQNSTIGIACTPITFTVTGSSQIVTSPSTQPGISSGNTGTGGIVPTMYTTGQSAGSMMSSGTNIASGGTAPASGSGASTYGTSSGLNANATSEGLTGTGGPFTFSTDLSIGSTGSDVTELQKFLIGENYLSATATGYFGTLTQDAVKKFQEANGVTATGYVGPLTRAQLNK